LAAWKGKSDFLALLFMAGNEGKIASDDPASPFGEPVVLAPSDCLDLHPFQPRDIPSVVKEFLEQCCRAGFRQARLIHGKGKGVQRNIVHALLEKHPAVESFQDAPLEAGSWGATMVVFKKS
jgi:DNA-nicking Smr family endonuclease